LIEELGTGEAYWIDQMLNEVKIAGLLTNALLPSSQRDRGRPNTANLPWWVTEEMTSFRRADTMAVNANLEADFLVVPLTPFPDRVDESKHFFDKLLDAASRMIQMPLRIKDARA
jgi:hypothetical protein